MKNGNVATVTVFVLFFFGLTLLDVAKEPSEISVAERRELAQSPELSFESALDGSFSKGYAAFLQDQVVFRDDFRAIKAFIELKLLRKKENNGVYVLDNEIVAKFYGINQRYIDRAADLTNDLIESIDSSQAYLGVIPSKAHTLNRDEFLLSDQNAIADTMKENTAASYIDLMGSTDSRDLYYRTDHHWTSQGAIQAYKALATAMGLEPIESYDFEEVGDSFVGSNYGKAASNSIEKDRVHLAHNEVLDAMSVCRYETADVFNCFDSVYFRDRAGGLDPYDLFLGGAGPVITIENDRAASAEELILFKDSYSHALAPFLAQHFRKVWLFDLRYVRKEYIFEHFDLDGKTVLFLFSTTILNTDPQILN